MRNINHVYVHIPFCKKKCPYCDFYSDESGSFDENEYHLLIKKEIKVRNLQPEPKTIYFGGGTPSLFSPKFFKSFIGRFKKYPKEITVELNPEDININYLQKLKKAGITRVSIGIQTFNNRLLKIIGRRHNAEKAISALEIALSVFENVSADLMIALPEQTEPELLGDISLIKKFDKLKHISIYGFTLYKDTPMFKKRNRLHLSNDSMFENFYRTTVKELEKLGFRQYEISNFSKKNFECKHNLSYWLLHNYVGLGPAGASFINNKYFKNISNIEIYRKNLWNNKNLSAEEINFSSSELLKLKIGMGLRTIFGIALSIKEKEIFEKTALKSQMVQELLKEKIIFYNQGILKLNRQYFTVFNYIVTKIVEQLQNS